MEATGEDPWLNALYARAMVEGYQGADLRENDTLAACVKHLAAYGAAEAGRDYHSVELGSYSLREFYLPAYKAAIDAGAAMGMAAFHALNGTPCSANAPLLRGTVREEWGFDGVLISDWGAVHELIPHGIAENGSEAARLALQAGVDIEMMTADYLTCGEEMVRRGQMEEARINEAVRRILTLKEKLGLFDDPFRGTDAEKETRLLACASHRASAREAAVQSLVLLKNSRGILPLRQEQKIAVIGPYAETTALLGGWSCIGWEGEVVTLRQGIEQKAGENAAFAGCGVRPGRTEIEKAVRAAEKAEIVVMALGEAADMSGKSLPGRFFHYINRRRSCCLEDGLWICDGFPNRPTPCWRPGSPGRKAALRSPTFCMETGCRKAGWSCPSPIRWGRRRFSTTAFPPAGPTPSIPRKNSPRGIWMPLTNRCILSDTGWAIRRSPMGICS